MSSKIDIYVIILYWMWCGVNHLAKTSPIFSIFEIALFIFYFLFIVFIYRTILNFFLSSFSHSNGSRSVFFHVHHHQHHQLFIYNLFMRNLCMTSFNLFSFPFVTSFQHVKQHEHDFCGEHTHSAVTLWMNMNFNASSA